MNDANDQLTSDEKLFTKIAFMVAGAAAVTIIICSSLASAAPTKFNTLILISKNICSNNNKDYGDS